jgi:aminopeptidase N
MDSLKLSITVPKKLMAVGNGRLTNTKTLGKSKIYIWEVKNPISNYAVNANIANYTHFSDTYQGENGPLSLDYYVLPENEKKARDQFNQVPKMLEAFEYWFGPYPFYEDGYKLVEVPYLGMEHQSSVTYGNGYKNGYKGTDWSRTGWGLKFDFIIIHESGHEWFANNITNKDVADMWIHESFTCYSESLYLDYHFGTRAANEYVQGIRVAIQNDRPIIGTYNVHSEGSSDMYFKGANMLHTLRQWINDDTTWKKILRGLNKEFYHQTVTTQQIENYIAVHSGLKLEPFFNQYLRTTMVPTLEYRFLDGKLMYRWQNVVDGFSMPVKVQLNSEEIWLEPTSSWNALNAEAENPTLKVDRNIYIGVMDNTVVVSVDGK